MSVLGIDPGTATTGYGIIEEDPTGKIQVIDFGVILTSSITSTEMRLLTIYQEIKRIIALHRPQTGAVEKLFFQRNVTNAISVGQARGVILLAFAEANITLGEYTPTEVKNAVTGYGAADKMQVQRMVKEILGLDEIPKPDDAADALAIAICHVQHNGYLRLNTQGK